jgi:hypothetical protein
MHDWFDIYTIDKIVPVTIKSASIVVFHGTKHEFDEFCTDKIGTGEGGRAFGHGIYLADVSAVAEYYRAQQTSSLFPPRPDHFTVDRSAYEKKGQRYFRGDGDEITKEEYGKAFVRAQEEYETRKKGGFIYTVRIEADDDNFIDWGKKLSEQSDKVKKVIEESVKELNMPDPFKSKTQYTGREIYNWVTAAMSKGDVNRASKYSKGDQEAASKYLFSKGIAGIRYLDSFSRSGGSQTYDYVVFDASILKIIKRDGAKNVAD